MKKDIFNNKIIIDLTEDKEFNEYIEYLSRCKKRDKVLMPILYAIPFLSVLLGLLIYYILDCISFA